MVEFLIPRDKVQDLVSKVLPVLRDNLSFEPFDNGHGAKVKTLCGELEYTGKVICKGMGLKFLGAGAFTVTFRIQDTGFVLKVNICAGSDSAPQYWQYCVGRQGQPLIPKIPMIGETHGIPWCVMREYFGASDGSFLVRTEYPAELLEIEQWADTSGYVTDLHDGNLMSCADTGQLIIIDATSWHVGKGD